MDAKVIIGRFIRNLREQKKFTQERLAGKTGITYQYLSGLENGRENFSIDILESLSQALACPMPQLIAGAFAPKAGVPPPVVKSNYFNSKVPLPPGLKLVDLETAMNAAQRIIAGINANLNSSGAKTLQKYIQGNNFSGLISNIFCDAINDHSAYKHNSHQAYPDLINPSIKGAGKPAGLEVKSTIQIGKGGESHNGHSGWHCVACFAIEPASGNIQFVHVMFAVLNSHSHSEPDWTYVGSRVNTATGSRRTETYNTTLIGTTKLRDGSVYLDPSVVDFKRWHHKRHGPIPHYSIFAKA